MTHLQRKIKVPVDFDDLCGAFEFGNVSHRHYLDLETGDIVYLSDESMDADEIEKMDEKVESGLDERYIAIPYVSSDESYEDMMDFTETVEALNLRHQLYTVLNGRSCFRRFKDILLNYPKERERWFKFHDARLGERVKEWLKDKGIELTRQAS